MKFTFSSLVKIRYPTLGPRTIYGLESLTRNICANCHYAVLFEVIINEKTKSYNQLCEDLCDNAMTKRKK